MLCLLTTLITSGMQSPIRSRFKIQRPLKCSNTSSKEFIPHCVGLKSTLIRRSFFISSLSIFVRSMFLLSWHGSLPVWKINILPSVLLKRSISKIDAPPFRAISNAGIVLQGILEPAAPRWATICTLSLLYKWSVFFILTYLRHSNLYYLRNTKSCFNNIIFNIIS